MYKEMPQSLKKSIIILARLNNQLVNANNAFKFQINQKHAAWNERPIDSMKIHHIDSSMFALIIYSIINYKSFKDEYNTFFSVNLFKDEVMDDEVDSNSNNLFKELILQVKRASKPHFKKMNILFGNLEKARNTVLAHGYRNDKEPLTNRQINEVYNILTLQDDITVYDEMHNATSAVIAEIEIIFGKIPENDISLSEETIIVGDWNLHQEGIDSENE